MRIDLPRCRVDTGLFILLVILLTGNACGVGHVPPNPLSLAVTGRDELAGSETALSLNTNVTPAPPAPDFALPWPSDLAPPPRTVDASGTMTINGDDCAEHSANANPNTPGQLQLNAETWEISWGIYAFGGIDPNDGPFGISIELADEVPWQYYLGVANYALDAWEWTELATPTGDDYCSVPAAWQPVSGMAYVYAAVLVWSDQAAAVTNVSLHLNVDVPPPLDLEASDGESGSTIFISWTDPGLSFPGLDYEGVLIERAISPDGPYTELEVVPAGSTMLNDIHDGTGNSLPYNAPVYYRASTMVDGRPGPPGPLADGFRLLADVTGFSGTVDSPWEVALSWNEVPGAEFYRLDYRAEGGGEPADWEVLVQTPFTSYGHNELDDYCAENQIYEYRIKAHYLEDASLSFAATAGMRRGLPVADVLLWPETVMPGEIVEIDATGSYDPGGGGIVNYRLDIDSDGTYEEQNTGGTFTFYYGRSGDYLATVEVTDDEGDTATGSVPVSVPGWQHTWGGAEVERGFSVAADSSGNVYVGGTYFGMAVEDYIALAKYDSAGQRQWSRCWGFGGSTHNYLQKVAVDSSSNAYLAGHVETASGYDAFTAKVLPDGTLDWTKTWGTSGSEMIWDASLEDTGHWLLCGTTDGFAASSEALILLYDFDGNLSWSKTWGISGDNQEGGESCLIDPGGWDELYFGVNLTSGSDYGLGVLVLDNAANIYTQQGWWHTAEYMGAPGLTVDGYGSVYLAGYICDIGGYADGLILKMEIDGDFVWQKRWNSSLGKVLGEGWEAVCFDGLNLHLFGNCASSAGTNADALWVMLDDNGDSVHQLAMGGDIASESITGVQRDSAGAIYLAGTALDSSGSWRDQSGILSDLSGTVTTLSGAISDVSGTDASPMHSVINIDPVVDDTGGGTDDILVSKLGPIS